MITPTRPQVQVLRSLQIQSVIVTTMLAEAAQYEQHSGQRPPPSWFEVFHNRATLREALSDVALAGGVPRAWVDHVRERGDRAMRWNPDLYLRTPEPLNWDEILGGLDTQVQRLREWTALSAAYSPIAARTEDGSSARFDHNLQVLRARTAGVANLLGVNTEQAHQLWGAEGDWVAAGVAMLDGVPVEGLAQRWHQVARTDTRTDALQARALAEAGIAIDAAVALPSHEALKSAISAALTPPTPLFLSAATAGAAIDAAVDAASPIYSADAETVMDAPIFSDSTGTEPWSAAQIDVAAAAPMWQEAEP
ncbi:hypothetical protein OIE68_16965 [Nocardia vinacea]|uniref:hypothetical protein n=1 Tax=Nocardia vinacea TaxID=96468 RepID=UPI002E123CF6|nr:hypothetical protein OIE68_16965 [Nocardia vinacea]